MSIAELLFGTGEGDDEADREVALLPWEFGRDESKESDDELGRGDRLGMLGNGLSEEVVGSTMVGLAFIAIAILCYRVCDCRVQVCISVRDRWFVWARNGIHHSLVALPLTFCCLSARSCKIVDLFLVEKFKRGEGFRTQVHIVCAPIAAHPRIYNQLNPKIFVIPS